MVNLSEIRALVGIIDDLDYYEILQVQRGAANSQIRSAYHEAGRRFHPDGLRDVPADVRASVTQISKRIAEAYSVLRDARRRQVYDRRLDAGEPKRMPLVEAEAEAGRQGREAQDGRTPNGKKYYALVRGDLARGDKDAAWRNLKMALTYEPDNEFFKGLHEKLRLRA